MATKLVTSKNTLRRKGEEARLIEAMKSIAHLKGAAKKKTTNEEYEKIREQVFEEFEKSNQTEVSR